MHETCGHAKPGGGASGRKPPPCSSQACGSSPIPPDSAQREGRAQDDPRTNANGDTFDKFEDAWQPRAATRSRRTDEARLPLPQRARHLKRCPPTAPWEGSLDTSRESPSRTLTTGEGAARIGRAGPEAREERKPTRAADNKPTHQPLPAQWRPGPDETSCLTVPLMQFERRFELEPSTGELRDDECHPHCGPEPCGLGSTSMSNAESTSKTITPASPFGLRTPPKRWTQPPCTAPSRSESRRSSQTSSSSGPRRPFAPTLRTSPLGAPSEFPPQAAPSSPPTLALVQVLCHQGQRASPGHWPVGP
jgi:hypothetical protein